jgi:ribonuclease E
MAPNDTSPSEESTTAPRKRAPRRSTRKQAAPAHAPAEEMTSVPSSVPDDVSAAQVLPELAATDAPELAATDAAAEAPPAKKPARKRATRKRAAPAPGGATEAAAEVPAVEPADDADAGPRADDRAGSVTEEVTVADEAPHSRDAEAPLASEAAPTMDAGDEDEAADEDDATASAAGAGTVVTSFSVLFKAPEPAAAPVRRRSRQVEPVLEPEPEPLLDEEPSEPADRRSGQRESGMSEESDDESPGRSRRRRGGKGRRGRSERSTDEAGQDDRSAETEQDDEEHDRSDLETADRGSARSADRSATGEDQDRSDQGSDVEDDGHESTGDDEEGGSSRRRRRRRRPGSDEDSSNGRTSRARVQSDEPVGVKGSTRLEAKKQRRREGREAGRRRTVITEAEFLARREAVERIMVVRTKNGRTQMGVLEDGVLVEHYIDQATNVSMAGNIYLGRVQNVLPSMEAAFVDIGKGRNAVLYAGEVNWDAAGLETNQPRRIENALSSGQTVLVQVTKDPIGHKGARLTSQISLPGRYLVYVPNSSMTGISRKLPDTERARLKKILREVVPEEAGVIVRTAAEGATEAELRADVERLAATWELIRERAEAGTTPKAGKSKGRKKNGATGSTTSGNAPMLLHGEPDLTVRVIRDVFNEDFKELVVAGEKAWDEIHPYISSIAPDLADRVTKWTATEDLFTHHRVDEQLAKAMDRKVWLPSGGSLVIDRTEAMTVVDVNTGKFVGSGGNLEETVTKNNIEAAEEIVRQLRLRDIGGIIVVDFIDMVLEANRDLVVRRLLECLGRDRTKHQVAEVTSLGLVQMTRKRVGSGLIEVFSETCEHCNGRGFIIHADPVDRGSQQSDPGNGSHGRRGRKGTDSGAGQAAQPSGSGGRTGSKDDAAAEPRSFGPTAAQIAAAAHAAALKGARPTEDEPGEPDGVERPEATQPELAELETSRRETEQRPTEPEAAQRETMQPPTTEQPTRPEEAASEQDAVQPTGRRPRRRGRVVAPAGAPGSVHATHVVPDEVTVGDA